MSDEGFDRAFASDLDRAIETARIVLGDRNLDITPDARLREFDFGAWEGLTWDEILARWPDSRDRGSTAANLYRPEGGESFEEVTARVAEFLADLQEAKAERTLVVTHAGVLHAVLAVLGDGVAGLPEDPLSVSFSPAGLTRIRLDGECAQLLCINDVSHLS